MKSKRIGIVANMKKKRRERDLTMMTMIMMDGID